MAVVPYKPVPDVGISQQATPMLDTSASPVAFGSTIANAIESIGKVTAHAGDEIFARAVALQELENDAIKTQGETEFIIRAGEIEARYRSTEGKNAVSGNPSYNEEIRKLRQDIANSMPNPSTRKKFDAGTMGDMGRHIVRGAGHAASQNRRMLESTEVANQAAATSVAAHTTDPASFEAALQRATSAAARRSEINGDTQPVKDYNVFVAGSAVYEERISGLVINDPLAAKRFFEENRDKILGPKLDNIEKNIKLNLYRVESGRIARDTLGVLPEEGEAGPSRRELIERAEARARELVPGDEDFVAFTRDRLGAEISKRDAVVKNDRFINQNTIEGALMGRYGNGSIPTTPEELMGLDPAAQQAWQRLNEKDQRKYMEVMAKNARGNVSWTREGLREFQRIKGLAHEKPEEFVGMSLTDLPIPFSERRNLIALQEKMKAKPEADPRVTKAMGIAMPLLNASGITPTRDRDKYLQFVGTMQDFIADYQKDKPGKYPTRDEILKATTSLLGEQKDPEKWFSSFITRKTPLYELSLPDQLLKEFKDDPRWIAEGREPNEADIELFRRQYIRERYKELYGTSGSTPVRTQSFPKPPTIPQSR